MSNDDCLITAASIEKRIDQQVIFAPTTAKQHLLQSGEINS